MRYREIVEEDTDFDIWNPDRLQIPHSPDYIGTLSNKSAFSSSLPSCLDMPIKFPNGEMKVPYKNGGILEFIERAIQNEKNSGRDINNSYMYLTVDQRDVVAGNTHRKGGAHFDGLQGTRYEQKLPADYSYVVSDFNPTKFFTQAFDARHLSLKHDNWYKQLEKQIQAGKYFIPKPYEIYLMTSYQMHESPPIVKNGTRTFCRLEFSHKKFDRIGNTKNPLLPTNWTYVDRQIPDNLKTNLDPHTADNFKDVIK